MRKLARELALSAKEGFAYAQRELGHMYYFGDTKEQVGEDRIEGVQLLCRAAQQGDEEALAELMAITKIAKLALTEAEERSPEEIAILEQIAFYETEVEIYSRHYADKADEELRRNELDDIYPQAS